MSMRKTAVLSLLLSLVLLPLGAQNVSDLVITEIMAAPDSTSVTDPFGERVGWIEVFNNSQGTVNIGGCFLTNDRSNLKKSVIPKGYTASQILPRQALVFYANGRGGIQGLQYANFTLDPGQTVYLVSNDGRTIIDSLAIPSILPAGQSVVKEANDAKGIDFKVQAEFYENPTPGAPNSDPNKPSKSERLKTTDPYGLTLALVSILVVLCALAILWGLFTIIFGTEKKKEPKPKKVKKATTGSPDEETAAVIALALEQEVGGGPVYAAISMALHLYLTECIHDNESYILTIRPAGDSAWNSKGQTFRRRK